MKRLVLFALVVLSFLAGAYSVLGLLMIGSFEAAGHYAPERARFNENFWSACTIVFFSLAIAGSIVLWRRRQRQGRES